MHMKKQKISLDDIKVESFVTKLDEKDMNKIKGGYMKVRGHRFTYRTRWTMVDTRTEPGGDFQPLMFNNNG